MTVVLLQLWNLFSTFAIWFAIFGAGFMVVVGSTKSDGLSDEDRTNVFQSAGLASVIATYLIYMNSGG